MKLKEETQLRRLIRRLIVETRVKVNSGWEGYRQGCVGDANDDIDAGYDAAYYEQYANKLRGMDHVAELDAGGDNVIDRKRGRTSR